MRPIFKILTLAIALLIGIAVSPSLYAQDGNPIDDENISSYLTPDNPDPARGERMPATNPGLQCLLGNLYSVGVRDSIPRPEIIQPCPEEYTIENGPTQNIVYKNQDCPEKPAIIFVTIFRF